MTSPLEIQPKRVVLRLRTSEFDNGKPDVIYEIAGAYLVFSGRSKEEIAQDKHYVHWEPPQHDPRGHFHITIDMNYRIKTPDLETVHFEFVRGDRELAFKPLQMSDEKKMSYARIINSLYSWGATKRR